MFSRSSRKVIDARARNEKESAAEFCRRTIEGMAAKADEKKKETLWLMQGVVVLTALIPIFIAFGPGVWIGKVVPSLLSAFATMGAAWLQIRRPQELWGIYRAANRELEDQETKYLFRIGDYLSAADPDKLLAERVARIALRVHQQWMPLIPTAEDATRNLDTERSNSAALRSTEVQSS